MVEEWLVNGVYLDILGHACVLEENDRMHARVARAGACCQADHVLIMTIRHNSYYHGYPLHDQQSPFKRQQLQIMKHMQLHTCSFLQLGSCIHA